MRFGVRSRGGVRPRGGTVLPALSSLTVAGPVQLTGAVEVDGALDVIGDFTADVAEVGLATVNFSLTSLGPTTFDDTVEMNPGVQLLIDAGTAAAPGLAFTNAGSGYGIYSPGVGSVGVGSSGNVPMYWNGTGSNALGVMTLASYLEMTEIAAPGVAPANKLRLYAVDNGAGKTRLADVFPSGGQLTINTEA